MFALVAVLPLYCRRATRYAHSMSCGYLSNSTNIDWLINSIRRLRYMQDKWRVRLGNGTLKHTWDVPISRTSSNCNYFWKNVWPMSNRVLIIPIAVLLTPWSLYCVSRVPFWVPSLFLPVHVHVMLLVIKVEIYIWISVNGLFQYSPYSWGYLNSHDPYIHCTFQEETADRHGPSKLNCIRVIAPKAPFIIPLQM